MDYSTQVVYVGYKRAHALMLVRTRSRGDLNHTQRDFKRELTVSTNGRDAVCICT